MKDGITPLRNEIADLDRALLEILERRFRLAAEVGRLKAEEGRPVVVREVEQRILARARGAARSCGTSPEVMEAIFAAIINGSVERQHRVGVEMRSRGGKKVLVLGAAGAMGGWFCRFLDSIGHNAEGADTAWGGLPPSKGRHTGLDDVADLNAFDALIVSVPLEATADLLASLSKKEIAIPVFEIASIKSHLTDSIEALRRTGTPVISIHPMFGPGKNLYEPLTMVHAAGADEAAERSLILELMAHPYLDLVGLPFKEHDRLMGWLLGLAHMTGMLFAGALHRAGLDPQKLKRVASTTFSRQVSTARSVLDEDAHLYFAIQRLNPFRGDVYETLRDALDELTGAVEQNDRESFAGILTRAGATLS